VASNRFPACSIAGGVDAATKLREEPLRVSLFAIGEIVLLSGFPASALFVDVLGRENLERSSAWKHLPQGTA
jgi:hypothetical protein